MSRSSDPFSDIDRLRLVPLTPPMRPRPTAPAKAPRKEVGIGAWLPWAVVEQATKLRLGPPSRQQVFWLLLCVSCRFGGREARLSVAEIAERTGLSERTVKSAIKDLVAAGLVQRTKRYRTVVITLLATTPPFPTGDESPVPRA